MNRSSNITLQEKYIVADAKEGLQLIPDKTVDTCITSPPYYGLRDYGHSDQLGLEPTPEEYIERLVQIFREVRRTLKDDGTLWIVIGDCLRHSLITGHCGRLRLFCY